MMGIALLLLLFQAPDGPGPAFIRVETATARACPRESCASAGQLSAGEVLRVQEIEGAWARCMAESGLLTAWVPLAALASGMPLRCQARAPAPIYACPEPGCALTATVAAGVEILLVEERGNGALVASGATVGYVRDRTVLEPAPKLDPEALPREDVPKYLPPPSPPAYIPPAQAPRYVPGAAPPLYVPEAIPAARADDPTARAKGILYVRQPALEPRRSPRADAEPAGAALPGGAKLYELRAEGEWIEVSPSPPSVRVPLGWVRRADLRELPPLRYRVKVSRPRYRPCLDPRPAPCPEQRADAVATGDTTVAIDQSADGKHLLCLLPGVGSGAVWVKAEDLE